MTRARALLLQVFDRYLVPGYRLSLLEAQKLAYFLQAAGEPMKLRYTQNRYGPYAENLNHVLQQLDGHYIRGYGDRTRQAAIYLLPGAFKASRDVIEGSAEAKERLDRIERLIQGFESPYGMELLASVHWVTTRDSAAASDVDLAVEQVQHWSQRKREKFRAEHIRKAWERLQSQGWLDPNDAELIAAA